jgi:hypothetical protein
MKISLTLKSIAAFLAEQAARRDGLSVSAWLSKLIHQTIHHSKCAWRRVHDTFDATARRRARVAGCLTEQA